MTIEVVYIESESVSKALNIVAIPSGVKFVEKGTIQFDNYLGKEATVTFYHLNAKGIGPPIVDFCKTGLETNGTLKIDPVSNLGVPGTKSCETNREPADYAYTIDADDHNSLDPVIIIDPKYQASAGPSVIVLAALLAGVAGFAYFFGFARGKMAS